MAYKIKTTKTKKVYEDASFVIINNGKALLLPKGKKEIFIFDSKRKADKFAEKHK